MKKALILLFFVLFQLLFGQKSTIFSFSEYLASVKKHHPIVKQANLVLQESEAKLLKARGSFDPKIMVDYDKKQFKESPYYDRLNATFKIPTWYGVEIKGMYEQNTGVYLNPENSTPENGLYNVGVSVSLARGLLMNKRMATLKQAKLYMRQAEAENQMLVNDILYQASLSYFDWVQAYKEQQLYSRFLQNAFVRWEGVKKSYFAGDKPAIDTVEAAIAYKNRVLNLEKAKLKLQKTSLALSNYLWIDEVPVELQNTTVPQTDVLQSVDGSLGIDELGLETMLGEHPKLVALDYKLQGLKVENRLKKNNLLPKIDLNYNFLQENDDFLSNLNTANYKAGISVSFPLFLRKERGDLRLNRYKMNAVDYEKRATEWSIKNKLNATQQEIVSYQKQLDITEEMVADYQTMLRGEERKFEIGESSLFLINSRESKLIQSKKKTIELENAVLQSKGKLFNVLYLDMN